MQSVDAPDYSATANVSFQWKKNQKLFRSKSFRLHFKKINKWLSGHLDIEKLKQFYEILSGHQKFSAMTTIFTQSHKFQ